MEWFDIFLMPVTIIQSLGCGYYFYRLSSFFVDYRKHKLNSVIVTAVFGLTAMTPMLGGDRFNITALIVLHGIMLLLCATGSAANRLAVLLLFFPILTAANYITFNNPVYGKILMLQISGHINSQWIFWYFIGSGALKLAIAYLLWRLFKRRVLEIKKYVTRENWFRVDLLCLAPFCTAFIANAFPPLLSLDTSKNGAITGNIMTYVLMASAVLSNLSILFFLQPLIENMKYQSERQTYRIRQDYYESLEQQQKRLRQFRHDMNNHMQMLHAYLTEKDYEAAASYLEQFEKEAPLISGRSFCADKALNAVIDSRYTRMLEEGIDTHFNISIGSILGIDIFDLCTIFANALDNALEASQKVKDKDRRKVELRVKEEKGFFSFHLMNYKENLITEKGGLFLSDKENEKDHGFGVENIKSIVDKYGGKMEIEHDEKKFVLFLYMRN